jgi:hypothetical protein
MALAAVETIHPAGCKLVADRARELADRADKGEIETIFYVIVRPDGSWATNQSGTYIDILRCVGALEGLKSDLLTSSKRDTA